MKTLLCIQDKANEEVQYQCKFIEQVDIQLNSIYPMLKPMMYYWENVYGNNNDVFYTHANHLGSASWITDKNGKPIQYIHYAPYGELIANQNGYGYDERFKFTGKERDEESGYDFFGARYYDSRKGFWNSVDPLADKYPNVTPYIYCNGNPVMLVDPNGKEKKIYVSLISDFFNYQAAQNYIDDNKYIHIWAHGVTDDDGICYGMSFCSDTGRPVVCKGGVEVANHINNILKASNLWKQNAEEGIQSVLVLHSCRIGQGENSIAQQVSSQLKNIFIVAPNDDLINETTDPNGHLVCSQMMLKTVCFG